MIDPLTRLTDLPSAEPTQARAARIRRRCRAELARRSRQALLSEARPDRVVGARLWVAAVTSLCVTYVVDVIVVAAEILRAR